MAYPSPFLRLQVQGTLAARESFSWSLSLIPDFDNTPEAPETVPQSVVDAVTAFHVAQSGPISALETIKMNLIGTDGRYVSQSDTVLAEVDPPRAGGPSSANYPPQVALAVSLTTASRRGLAHSGRFYIPAPKPVVQADGLIPASAARDVANDAATLINALNGFGAWRVGVVSNVGSGARRAVTGVRVGRVLDTIRSRRTSLLEDYQENDTAITA